MIGEVNPVLMSRAVRQALEYLDNAGWTLAELDQLYALRAKRGPYNGNGTDESDDSDPESE